MTYRGHGTIQITWNIHVITWWGKVCFQFYLFSNEIVRGGRFSFGSVLQALQPIKTVCINIVYVLGKSYPFCRKLECPILNNLKVQKIHGSYVVGGFLGDGPVTIQVLSLSPQSYDSRHPRYKFSFNCSTTTLCDIPEAEEEVKSQICGWRRSKER